MNNTKVKPSFYRFFRMRTIRITAPAAARIAPAVSPNSSIRLPGVSPCENNGSPSAAFVGAGEGAPDGNGDVTGEGEGAEGVEGT